MKGILEKADLGPGPDPREKPDPGPLGKTGPIFPSAKNGLWTLKKNRTLSKTEPLDPGQKSRPCTIKKQITAALNVKIWKTNCFKSTLKITQPSQG